MRVCFLGAGPGLYFDLATLSSQVPSTGSAAQTASAEPRMSVNTRLERAYLDVLETAEFSICPPVLGAVYSPTGAGSRGVDQVDREVNGQQGLESRPCQNNAVRRPSSARAMAGGGYPSIQTGTLERM